VNGLVYAAEGLGKIVGKGVAMAAPKVQPQYDRCHHFLNTCDLQSRYPYREAAAAMRQ
jgi:hypothetical protein